ncbi:MAG: anthranilate phosphoribosyltransferase [Candidatus Micrarchaeia archaeon]
MISEAIKKLVCSEELTREEAYESMLEILRGEATDAQIAAFLIALRMKGESPVEIASFVRAMRESCVKIRAPDAVDTCGTGGDLTKTFNISTCSAFVIAGAGIRVAKHGNRAVTSKAGSADVLEALGVKIDMQPADVQRCIDELGICFMFAPIFHPAMRHAVKVRREIAIRTVFNMLGPLTNPAGVKRQVVGVYSLEALDKVAGALAELGCEHAFVVHGEEGIDECSVCGKTQAREVVDGRVEKRTFSPDDFGLARHGAGALSGGDAGSNAKEITAILKGELKGAKLDAVLANSALGIIVGGGADDLREGVAIARESIESGMALKKLEQMRNFR